MDKVVKIIALTSFVTACTSIQVQPLTSGLNIKKICIEENPRVIVSDFLSVVRNRIEYHGINTQLFENKIPKGCEYTMTYTALKNWDIGTYMHHAELRLEKNGQKVGYAEYHLKNKGGLSLLKWQGTKTKMQPVVDKLLGK